MTQIDDSLTRADELHFTRHVPKSAGAQMRFLVKQLKSTRETARLLGISQRTVERYVKDQIKQPKPALAGRLESEVRRRWQPLVRKRARDRAASTTGLVIETRARFGFTAAPGTTDDGRMRRITQHLPPEYAARLFSAQAAGAAESRLQQIAAEALQEMYFKDNGSRATGLLVEFTDIDYVDFAF
ncbi:MULTISPECIES: telomere-protecting terminal protein Tpg [unclassified Streptomyces]|uniref:telomere-protecting terminal protein Tpg n=1 Tax=unclassified Streptomyces TaxID=2593676 RepID=UPI000A687101|nr:MULTISPECIES: XRE family transcriptional regulator [unclassified Streptomyces]MCX5151594.1 XRE family transcriptional regulator [Streptomyces sp. NBC_00320]WSN53990.1 XRE family transcriptional regulator [Streptomyces sp. NBC_01296]WSW64327.1 XRE family transcriptional regulator [Streptomyces sp. NBC_00998]